jgi:hypothetical protein
MSHIVRRVTVGVLCAAAGVAVPAAAHAAEMNVVAAVKAQDKVVKSSPAYQAVKQLVAAKAAQPKALTPKIARLDRTLEHAATVVGSASTSTSRQKQGQREWVTGVRDLTKGFEQLQIELKDLQAGRTSAARAAKAKGERLIKAGEAIGEKGDGLLGLPDSD